MQTVEDFGLNSLHNPVWIYDVMDYRIHWANHAALQLWEADDLEELCARDFKADSSEAVRHTLLGYLEDISAGRKIECWWQISPKGIDKQVYLRFSAIQINNHRTAMLIEGTHSELLNRSVSDIGVSLLLALFSDNGNLLSFNPPFKEQFGPHVSQFSDLFTHHIDLLSLLSNDSSHYEQDHQLITEAGLRWHRIELNKEKNSDRIIATLVDVHERKLNELKHAHASITDSLTDLLNRRGLLEHLRQLDALPYTLFYIDLDGFKPVNDSYGHAVGDALLKKVARILQRDIYANVHCARLGGDEFILVIPEPLSHEERKRIANRLVERLSKPMQVDELHRTLISASIGVANNTNDQKDPEHVLTCADAAMYLAKRNGRNRYVSYLAGMEEQLLKRTRIIQSLEEAIQEERLSLYYQIIHNQQKKGIVGAEALLRWNHPILGNIPPLEIVHAAEETGHIARLENWVIRRACQDLKTLREFYGPSFTVGVNLSGAHLSQVNFLDDLMRVLRETQTNPEDIVLELTESVLVNTFETGISTLRQLKELGFTIAIDDFGTGYSSLAYLQKIPASFVKVDKAFIDNIEQDPHTVRFIRDLCQNLKMECLVEGVENRKQAAQLDKLNIQYRQGYLYGTPSPIHLLPTVPTEIKSEALE